MQETATRENLEESTLDQPKLSTSDIANPSRTLPASETGTAAVAAAETGDASHQPLFPANELQTFRSQWDQAQSLFVDDPRRAVEQADGLVASTIQRLAQGFAEERTKLEGQWDRGEEVSTEDLRQILRRYRDFFGRLLSL